MTAHIRSFHSLAAALLMVAVGSSVSAEVSSQEESVSDERFSVGLVAGDPSALSFTASAGDRLVFQGLLGWDLLSPGGPAVAFDVLFRLGEVQPFRLPLRPYAGFGVKATILAGDGRFGDSSAEYGFGLRFPLGLRHLFTPWPIECFLEFAPGLRAYPGFAFDPDAVIGARILL